MRPIAKFTWNKKVKRGGILRIHKILAPLFLSIVFFSFRCGESVGDKYIGWVNGEGISKELFEIQLAKQRINTIDHFRNKYGVADFKNFWDSTYGNESPAAHLKSAAFDECVKILVQQIMAREKHLIESVGYDNIRRDFFETNKSRSRAVSDKKVIYGPEKYSELEFFERVFAVMVNSLKDSLSGREIVINTIEVEKYYNDNKEFLYKSKKGIAGFGEIEGIVKMDYLDSRYNNIISGRIKSANVQINEGLYKNYPIQ